ncbi:MAG TPA: polysaccharide biosynthesis C-terminal domain-containing protein [Xanthobacteraceae bacterium]|nr:polysaccharide biosynthesis C-terminal domain-containing protein [Xanthobacteraceae bacterium]
MLVGQTAVNFAANVISAVFGLINVMVFTRLFAPAEFGTYVLGAGFATIASAFMSNWLRLPIMREQARGDGTDIRGILLPGLMLSCLLAPLAYAVAVLAGIGSGPALAAAGLALAVGFFEIGQDLMRARLKVFTVMKATVVRAVLVSVFGIAVSIAGHTGVLLLLSSAFAYFLAALAFAPGVWAGTVISHNRARLLALAKAGIPFTASLTIYSLSSVIDRFIIAHLIGPAAAGQYSAGADLVRQALIIPAISAAAAFCPLAVRIYANHGRDAVRSHLEECFEFLLAMVLPASVGFAVVSTQIADVVFGPDFRIMAAAAMPIVSIAVIFQIMSYQYLHIGFLLSERNSFYFWNTSLVLVVNLAVSCVLIQQMGAVGAAWGRLVAEIFGFASALVLTRWAFPMPVPFLRMTRVLLATLVMAIVLRSLELAFDLTGKDALAILLPAGIATYLIMCWLLNVAKGRDHLNRGLLIVRNALAR